MKSCVYCGAIENLTRDHKIPHWLSNRSYLLGLKKSKVLRKELGKEATNIQILCGKCNSEKGGIIDYSIPEVRIFMKALRDEIDRNLAL